MADDRQPEQTPQLPAAASQPGEPAGERLEPPSPAGQALIAAHLADSHGIEPFVLAEHVHLGGPRPASQLITWHPAKATFHCELCPAMVFWTGEITPERIQLAQMFDQALAPHLVGLTSQEDRDEMARLHIQGVPNRERLRQLRGADARRRSARGARPTVEARRARLQPWLLERVRERGVLERVLDEAEEMQQKDPAGWAQLCDQKPSRETLRDWWQDIVGQKFRYSISVEATERPCLQGLSK